MMVRNEFTACFAGKGKEGSEKKKKRKAGCWWAKTRINTEKTARKPFEPIED